MSSRHGGFIDNTGMADAMGIVRMGEAGRLFRGLATAEEMGVCDCEEVWELINDDFLIRLKMLPNGPEVEDGTSVNEARRWVAFSSHSELFDWVIR